MWPLQVAVVARWKADAGVAAIVGERIFDGLAPQGTPMPYIRVGSKTENGRHVLGGDGWDDTLTADAFSDYPGDKEVLALVTAMKAALREPLEIAGFGSARLRQEFATTLVEEDGKVRHAPIRYRAYALETA